MLKCQESTPRLSWRHHLAPTLKAMKTMNIKLVKKRKGFPETQNTWSARVFTTVDVETGIYQHKFNSTYSCENGLTRQYFKFEWNNFLYILRWTSLRNQYSCSLLTIFSSIKNSMYPWYGLDINFQEKYIYI